MLGMQVTISAKVDRITIDESCLNWNVTLPQLQKKLEHVTHNVRVHTGEYKKIEVFFQQNDFDNLPIGYEEKVMKVIKENTHRVILFSNDMTLEAAFDAPQV